MRISTNVVVQIAAVIAAALLRLSHPGWMIIVAVITIVPLGAVVLPLALALATLRRGRLHVRAAVPFVAAAAVLVVLAAVYPEADDQQDWVPVAEILGLPSEPILDAAYGAGTALLIAYGATVVWTGIAVLTTRPATEPRR